ncbi:uncharacterized protein [Coffea arabica]|uniref:RNase H type-1 domain-containing protein n=1 Tax=Coffea arabica TaxID=13443 RepID=A0A6P6UDG1_COFAR
MIPKLNVNGCYWDNPGRAGESGILRDPSGHFIFAFANVVDVAKSLQADLKAAIERVRLCVQQGFADVHVELDSWLVVRMFHDEVGIPLWLMRDFEELLALRHHVCIMTHCFREANKSAVCLARVGITSGINRVFESLDQLPLEV